MRSNNDRCSASSSSDDIFDQCVHELELNGYALLSLPTLLLSDSSSAIARAFKVARRGLDVISLNNGNVGVPIIDPTSDSSSWTGYHNAASINGRYNEYREGFVFSNGDVFDMKNIGGGGETTINFENEMSNLFRVMHDNVANGVLRAIERRLELPKLYFHDEFGPTDNSSQWHMKRYNINVDQKKHIIDDQEEKGVLSNESTTTSSKSESKEAGIFLPVHTDPSLISVVILDHLGTNQGGLGLQVYHPTTETQIKSSGTYKEISNHGHDVAIIFVGSVLSYLTKGHIFAAAKHRVVNWTSSADNDGNNARMAATLFVRPNPSSIMKPIPSPHLQQLTDNVPKKKKNHHPTFRVWNARVAKNYMKKRESLR